MRNVSKKLVFSIEKLLNPTSSDFLLDKNYPKTVNGETGNVLFSFGSVKLSGRKSYIKNLSASILENYSVVGKSINPIAQISLFTAGSDSLQFVNNIDESKLAETIFKFDEVALTTSADVNEKSFHYCDIDRTPNNVIEFNTDIDDEFVYLPKAFKNKRTILDGLNKFYSISFHDTVTVPEIEIPSQSDNLIIFPYASIPIPVYKTFPGIGSIILSILVNFTLEER